MKKCPKCNIDHKKPGVFCSRKCANSRGPRTEEFKDLMRKKLSGKKGNPNVNKGKQFTTRVEKICPQCNASFQTTELENKKYCSRKCWKPNGGGYRNGSGRAKTGYYKGIYCGSTYELVWVIYNLDHNIKFSRFPGVIKNNDITYYPDFLLEDKKTIIEIKGYEQKELVDRKSKAAEAEGYSVKVLRKNNIQHMFEYVEKTYNSKKFYDLYDATVV